jgi:hypothetical protein
MDPAGGLQPAEPRHGDVAEHGIRSQFERRLDQGLAIGNSAQDGEFRLQQAPEGVEQQVVVVRE